MVTWGRTLVLDQGTGTVKAGFSGYDFPDAEYDCLSSAGDGGGAFEMPSSPWDLWPPNDGRAAVCPRGAVRDWDGLAEVWDSAARNGESGSSTAPTTLMLAAPAAGTAGFSAKALELAFERLCVSRAFVQHPAALSLYATGELTGLVVDVGHGATAVTPIVEGWAAPRGSRCLPVGGRDVTAALGRMLRGEGRGERGAGSSAGMQAAALGARQGRGKAPPGGGTVAARLGGGGAATATVPLDLASLEHIKKEACYVAADPVAELALAREAGSCSERVRLADGRSVALAEARFLAPEALFDPASGGLEHEGLGAAARAAVADAGRDSTRPLLGNVLLAGGGALCPGTAARLQRELNVRSAEAFELERAKAERAAAVGAARAGRDAATLVRPVPASGSGSVPRAVVRDPPRKRYLAFAGAAALAEAMEGELGFWVSKDEWLEDPRRAAARCGAA